MFFLFQGSLFMPFSSSVLGRVSNFRIPTNNLYDQKHIHLWCVGWFQGLNVCDLGLCWTKINPSEKKGGVLKSPTFTYHDSCIFPFNTCFFSAFKPVPRCISYVCTIYHLQTWGGDGKSTWLDNFAAGSSPPEMRLDIGGKWSGKAPFLCKPSVVTVTEGVSHRKICIWQVSDWVIESPECVFCKAPASPPR